MMGSNPQGLLDVDVQLDLDRFALDVSFQTSERVTGIFGVSGAGKTSLLETIAGLRRKAMGRIRLGSEVWLDSTARTYQRPEERGIGYVPQDGLLFPHLSVRGNLFAGRRRASDRGHDFEGILDSAVRLLELQALLERPVSMLSGGERQRVALARAICSGPSLLLLDEPLAALDFALRRRLLPFLRRVNNEFRLPSLLVSHDPIEVMALCDDLIVLQAGKAIARGKPRDVLTDPSIYPLAQHQSFENVLTCKVVETRDGVSRVALTVERAGPGIESRPVELITVALDAEPGDTVMLGLPAHEIMVAREAPRGLSARNSLSAVVSAVQPVDRIELVTARLADGVTELTVEVTDTTASSLGLTVGASAVLVFKATSCRVYGWSSP